MALSQTSYKPLPEPTENSISDKYLHFCVDEKPMLAEAL